ncbi:CCA-adding enzyme [Candidatus Bilamarchaeum dharawalense]|uniref:CCA-adding enzyme n=1 Tax=Candidatus Bilamarchaeum dharawalense TaxID=2885759 RepID=A0A5E4LW96_9ARCH|nr:CCA-adding enzyme [Candidatus Bilamarchaeum dharawalense]
MHSIFSKVLSVIKPSPQEFERELNFCHVLIFRIKTHIPHGCEIVLTGSMAKKTFLHDKKDVDIFVLFNRKVPKTSFEPALKKIMETCFPDTHYQLSYAEHPYARFRYEGRRIDLVPAYKINDASERLSAVDRSVLHTDFIRKNLPDKQIDDVLLLKKFLHTNSLYGAEIKIKGFSGYLCELLILHYGGFRKLLQSASKWKAPVFIDIKKYYKKDEVNGAIKKFGYLTVIDPTDKNRNVAAAVSEENFIKFAKLCAKFLKKPSESFFFQETPTFEEKITKLAKTKKVVVISMPRPEIVDDVLWGQIYKMIGQLELHLSEFKPTIIADDHKHLVQLAVVIEQDKLSSTMMLEGPPLDMKEHVLKFRKIHKSSKFIFKNNKIYAQAKRPIIGVKDAIKDFFKQFRKSPSHLACSEELVIIDQL